MKLRPLTHQKWRKTADLITAKDPGGSLRSSGGSIRASNVQALLQLKEAANRPFRSSAPLDPIPPMVKRRGSTDKQYCCAGQGGLSVAYGCRSPRQFRSEAHPSELQSLMRTSY